MEIKGVDISHWQGSVDFSKVSKDNDFCILKVSQRTTRDSMFFENYEKAKDKIKLGAYIYNKVTGIADAAEEANFAVMQLRNKKLPMGVWLDLEDATMSKLSILDLKKIIYKEASIIKEAGFNVGIYCNLSWYNTKFDNATKKEFPFWIARYADNSGDYKPERNKPKDAIIWQYTSRGNVEGINGNVDLNMLYKPIDEIFESRVAAVAKPLLYKGYAKNNKEEVKLLQQNLNTVGFVGKDKKALTVDGIFGNNTDYALKQFQLKYAVLGGADGKYGNNSYETMKQLII